MCNKNFLKIKIFFFLEVKNYFTGGFYGGYQYIFTHQSTIFMAQDVE